MKTFLQKLFLGCLLITCSVAGKTSWLLWGDRYQQVVAGKSVYHSLNKSQQKHPKTTKLLLGDSVGKQLFDNYEFNDSILSLACNQAVGLVGQYIFLNNFLANNPAPKEIILLLSPGSFSNNYDQVYTYQYFLKPFFRPPFQEHFSPQLVEQITSIPFSNLTQSPLIVTTNWSPQYGRLKTFEELPFLSPIAREYLPRLLELAAAYDCPLHLIPPPSRESNRGIFMKYRQEALAEPALRKVFIPYFDRLSFLSDPHFVDQVHVQDPLPIQAFFLKTSFQEPYPEK